MLLEDVEEKDPLVQQAFIELIGRHEGSVRPTNVRLMTSTTVSLTDRVAVGTFSDHLFYRLNLVHVRIAE